MTSKQGTSVGNKLSISGTKFLSNLESKKLKVVPSNKKIIKKNWLMMYFILI